MADNSKLSDPSQKKTNKNLKCKNLYEYLATLSQAVHETFYGNPTICLTVYRELPKIANLYVIKLLYVEEPISQEMVASWTQQAFLTEHYDACKRLSDLHIWLEAPIPGGLLGWSLSETFKKNLKIALMGGGKPWSIPTSLDPKKKAPDVDFLNAYAAERWESVLHCMVGSKNQKEISADAINILLHAGLMTKNKDDGSYLITRQGFQFVLLERRAQVWHFILQYLDTVKDRGLDLTECLTLLFKLNCSTLGKDYSSEGMSSKLQKFLQHLREFGLVYQRKRTDGRFYPTRLALNITKEDQTGESNLEKDVAKANIIVETNFKVNAYTASHLQISLLGLFVKILYRFPNFTIGILTRESIRQALQSGITSKLIIGYLKHNARPGVSQVTLPLVVEDQIKLWELEKERLVYSKGILYNQFLSQADFNAQHEYVQKEGYLIWSNKEKRTMVISKTGHKMLKKSQKHKLKK